ncbi:PAS domain S-box protein [Anabaena sp. UHCC 0253]|uniref:PAS domain S-box protein n=1 Tax=Anabaena sp. UHCC 0253 TaxID=2590019 RepID=UPI00352ABCF1
MNLVRSSSTEQISPLNTLASGFNQRLINLPNLHQIINYSPLIINPDSFVIDAINLMNQEQENSIIANDQIRETNDYALIVEEKQLQGIFTLKDVLRVIALGINLSEVKISQVMTQPPITLKHSVSEHILTAFSLFEEYFIQHLPIVDDEEMLIGIVSKKRLIQSLDLEAIVGVTEALQEHFTSSETEHKPINQELEVIRWQAYNYLQRWLEKQVAYSVGIKDILQETLEELQIVEEELRQQNEQLIFSRDTTEAERQRYQNLFEFAPNGYLVTDALGVIQEANHTAASLLCVPKQYLIGKPLVIFIAEQYRPECVSRLLKLQHIDEWEMCFQPRKGSPFPGNVRVNILFDSEGNRTGCIWSIFDISDRKQIEIALREDSDVLEKRVAERTAELVVANARLQQEIMERQKMQESLEESEERLSLAMEAGNTGIWDWHIQSNKTLWSHNMGPMYGLPSHTQCPNIEDFLSLIYPEDREYFRERVNYAIQERAIFNCQHRVVWRDGSIHWLSATGKVYYDETGKPKRMIGTTKDISERKLIEQQIYEQAALLDIATDGIFVRDFQAQILFWNQGAYRMYGWLREEVLGKNIRDIFYHSISCEQEIVALNTVVKSGIWQGELHKQTKSGQEIIVQSRWTLMLDGDDQPKSILTVDTDITEKKQLEEQFLRAQRLESIGTLAGGIAHDINNILTPILGSAQFLKGRFGKDKDHHQQMLTIIENNAKQGAALVRQLLSFARGVEGKYITLQVNDLIRDIIQLAQQTFSKSIKFYTHLHPKLSTVSGDKTQLHQVLMNLVVNAADAMPNGGDLSIATGNLYLDEEMTRINCNARVGNYIVISVTDTGMGMPPQVLERIFEPFFTTKDIGQGTGLGLSTVLGIIQSHKGFIDVASQVDRGSKFQIFLPSVLQEVPPLEPENHDLFQGTGELILIVDDEMQICEVTKTILENYNYQTLTAKNGMEAIALYAQHQEQIKVVLMDMMMPEMDGTAAIRVLKKNQSPSPNNCL